MCNLVRLYYTAIDIFDKGEIITYRKQNKDEYKLLMDIKNGKYLVQAGKFLVINKDYFDIIRILNSRFELLCEHNNLPNQINELKYKRLIEQINLNVINEGII